MPLAKASAYSGLAAFLGADFGFRLGTLHIAPRSQTLVAQNAQRLYFRTLPGALAVFEYLEVTRSGHAVLINRTLFLRLGAPQHQQFANVLDRRSTELLGQRLEHGLSFSPVIAKNAYLDESVGVERSVDFLFDVGGQAVAPDHHDGIQVVCVCTMVFALGRSQLNLRHVGIIPAMKTKTSSKKVNKAWLHDHINDPYVKLATREGYRARAAYKLKEIDEIFGLIKPGQLVVDLGCTPGAWSQYCRRRMSPDGAAVGALNGTIIGLDMLPMEPIEGVTFIQGDFREADVLSQLETALDGRQADVVVSDMAPNLSGISSADAARIENLVELAIEFAQNHMKSRGALVAKVFHGGSYNEVVQHFKAAFEVVKPYKPKASRDRSSETFLVGIGLKSGAK